MITLASAAPRTGSGNAFFIGVLAVLMTFGPMAVDMYLPALTAIGTAFHASQAQVQWSLSAFFLGFGIGQIVWGTLADRFGRRWPVVAGIMLYAVGCVGCGLADSVGHLAAWRFVQAIGACAGPVLARAMIRDVFERDRAASILSLMMLIMGIAPMAAPTVGGHILLVSSWRTIFWVQASFGVIALGAVLSVAETLPRQKRRVSRAASIAADYFRLLAHRRYLGYALCSGAIYGAMFAYISGTPFVYIQYFGVRPENYGLLFAVNIVGMIIVNTINSRIVMRYGSDRLLRLGCMLAAVAGLLVLACGLTGFGGLAGLAGSLILMMATTGMIAANAMAGAMSVYPQMAGSASALTGAVQFASGAAAGWVVGYLADGTPLPMAAVMCAATLLGAAFSIALVRSRPAAAPAPVPAPAQA